MDMNISIRNIRRMHRMLLVGVCLALGSDAVAAWGVVERELKQKYKHY